MSQTLLQDQQNNNQHDIRAMRWFFLYLVALWIVAAITGSILAFCLTGNPLCLSGFTALLPPAYVLPRIIKSLFPLDDRDYKIEEIKAQQRRSTRPAGKEEVES